MTENEKIQATKIAMAMVEEVIRARQKYPVFNSVHEGYGVLTEEYHELEAEVFKHTTDSQLLSNEAIQVGAMAIRLIQDCCLNG